MKTKHSPKMSPEELQEDLKKFNSEVNELNRLWIICAKRQFIEQYKKMNWMDRILLEKIPYWKEYTQEEKAEIYSCMNVFDKFLNFSLREILNRVKSFFARKAK